MSFIVRPRVTPADSPVVFAPYRWSIPLADLPRNDPAPDIMDGLFDKMWSDLASAVLDSTVGATQSDLTWASLAGRLSSIEAETTRGLDVYVDANLGERREQFRFPRSKRKRIRKKWAKNQRNWRMVYVPQIYRMGDAFIMDPVSYECVQREML